jgi:hypothetical protein
MATISIDREEKGYVWSNSGFTRFAMDPAPEGALLEDPLPFVIQAIGLAMRLRWKQS